MTAAELYAYHQAQGELALKKLHQEQNRIDATLGRAIREEAKGNAELRALLAPITARRVTTKQGMADMTKLYAELEHPVNGAG
jgi:hypothetical protein